MSIIEQSILSHFKPIIAGLKIATDTVTNVTKTLNLAAKSLVL